MTIPPLGLIPRFIVTEQRLDEIDAAMQRYRDAHMEIPAEWSEEREELLVWLYNWRRESDESQEDHRVQHSDTQR
jgi:hypothetical protein